MKRCCWSGLRHAWSCVAVELGGFLVHLIMTATENLKGFATSRPPLVVFTICLSLFAGVLLASAYYIKVHDIPNPDVSQDWNVFLENFADLEFCITGTSAQDSPLNLPEHSAVSTTSTTTTTTSLPSTAEETTPHNTDYESFRNYSVSLLLTIHPTMEFLRIHHNITHIAGTIKGSDLGLEGDAQYDSINITAELPYEWNATKCCETVKIYTCVHFIAPSHVFPASRSPPVCENLNETGLEYHARVSVQKPKAQLHALYCQSQPLIKVHYKFNPSLAVWLSMHDKSVINLHLMHTSYFLFVMVVTLFCYALFRGRPSKHKITQAEAKLLSESNAV